MSTHRDEVRAARGVLNRMAQKLGIRMDAERARPGATERTLSYETLKRINEQTPRTNIEQNVTDDPPAGTMDGANTTFTLSAPVSGENIVLIWHDASAPQQHVLTKSSVNPPASGAFYFNSLTPTVVVVGDPPAAEDGLVAVFKVDR